jgi:hypothetical protein
MQKQILNNSEPLKYDLLVDGRPIYSHKLYEVVKDYLLTEASLSDSQRSTATIVPVYQNNKTLILG